MGNDAWQLCFLPRVAISTPRGYRSWQKKHPKNRSPDRYKGDPRQRPGISPNLCLSDAPLKTTHFWLWTQVSSSTLRLFIKIFIKSKIRGYPRIPMIPTPPGLENNFPGFAVPENLYSPNFRPIRWVLPLKSFFVWKRTDIRKFVD
jgi:hypothetical protein